MSEFDAFENAAPTEEDPAAAFLAREQDQMAELEGEGFVVADGAETAGKFPRHLCVSALSVTVESTHPPTTYVNTCHTRGDTSPSSCPMLFMKKCVLFWDGVVDILRGRCILKTNH